MSRIQVIDKSLLRTADAAAPGTVAEGRDGEQAERKKGGHERGLRNGGDMEERER